MNYQTEKISISKIVKKTLGKVIWISILIAVAFFSAIYFYSGKAKKIIKADIQVETAKIQNAVKTFKEKSGKYPELSGREDMLNTVASADGKYTFDIFYGGNELYIIPENMKEGVEATNRIVTRRDNKGGWLYNADKGEIFPNIDEAKY